MKTVAIRFADKYAPQEGTIALHEKVIEDKGYVWFGKLGSPISEATAKIVLENEEAKILLLHSGKKERYWAYVTEIRRIKPDDVSAIPTYYEPKINDFTTWFRITKFELAEKDILSKCVVASSKAVLQDAAKRSMSSFFVIETEE
ncbi:hypothetical protein SAMN04487761_10378 [Lachnospiraceae bacterium C7]|nr:hypothetical protein SAMN04487761_10378 [Lachnospiraceae bacterium C7]